MAGRGFWNKRWLSITGVLATIFMLIGGGYSAGIYLGEVQCVLDKNELVVGYQEKLNDAQSKIKEYETKDIDEKTNNLNEVIKVLQKEKR